MDSQCLYKLFSRNNVINPLPIRFSPSSFFMENLTIVVLLLKCIFLDGFAKKFYFPAYIAILTKIYLKIKKNKLKNYKK